MAPVFTRVWRAKLGERIVFVCKNSVESCCRSESFEESCRSHPRPHRPSYLILPPFFVAQRFVGEALPPLAPREVGGGPAGRTGGRRRACPLPARAGAPAATEAWRVKSGCRLFLVPLLHWGGCGVRFLNCAIVWANWMCVWGAGGGGRPPFVFLLLGLRSLDSPKKQPHTLSSPLCHKPRQSAHKNTTEGTKKHINISV